MQLKNNTLIKATKENVFTEIEGETTILNTESGNYYGLNETGTVVWQQIQQTATYEELLDKLLQKFEIDQATCEADLENLLRELKEEGLIEISEKQ